MREDFRKSNLKSGMVVKLRNGEKRFVFSTEGEKFLYNKDFIIVNSLACYKDDLCSMFHRSIDIVGVFEPVNSVLQWDKQKLIWQRKEAESKEQLEKKLSELLGVSVENVESKKEKNKNEHIYNTVLHNYYNHSDASMTKEYVGEKGKEEDERFLNDVLYYFFNHSSKDMVEEYLRKNLNEKK